MEKLVSIIVPVYNVDKYLERCVNSIIQQSYRNLEIILVDDQQIIQVLYAILIRKKMIVL